VGSDASPPATAHTLARLGEDELRVLVALAAGADPSALPEFEALDVAAVADELRRQGLITQTGMAVTDAVARALGPFPAGLAPISAEPLDEATITQALGRIGDDDRRVLERLVWGPPQGTVGNAQRAVTWPDAASPIDRLLALRLLRPVDERTVILPREVALVLRGGRIFDENGERPALPRVQAASTDRRPAGAAGAFGERQSTDWRPVLDTAAQSDLWVQLAYAEEDGTLTSAIVRVLFVAHGSAYLVRRAGARLTVPTGRIISAQTLEPVVINDPPLEQRN